ncbi:TPA: glycosyltransferase family 4 protein [Enterococcus faecium]
MKRALIVASVASMIDQFNMENIKLLLSLGYKVEVAANFENPGNMSVQKKELLTAKLKQMRVEVHQIDFSRNMKQVKNHLIAYKQLKKVVANNKIDIIHCHSPIGGVISRLVGKTNNVKVIYTAHGFHFYKGAPLINWILYYPIEKLLSKFTDVIVTINKEDYFLCKKKFSNRKTIYIPGIGLDINKIDKLKKSTQKDIREEVGFSNSDVIVVSVGELNENKNHETIIRAIKLLDSKVKYLICGIGTQKEYLESLITKLGLSERVLLLGYRTDIVDILCKSDIFAFPSIREGLGMAALEAMRCKLPLVTSNSHGINDYSVNGITGFSYKAKDTVGFSNGIKMLSEDSKLRASMGSQNFKVVEQYDKEKVNLVMFSIYKECSKE